MTAERSFLARAQKAWQEVCKCTPGHDEIERYE
jgi:hypothetical protein